MMESIQQKYIQAAYDKSISVFKEKTSCLQGENSGGSISATELLMTAFRFPVGISTHLAAFRGDNSKQQQEKTMCPILILILGSRPGGYRERK